MKSQEVKFQPNVSGAYKHSMLTLGHLNFPKHTKELSEGECTVREKE